MRAHILYSDLQEAEKKTRHTKNTVGTSAVVIMKINMYKYVHCALIDELLVRWDTFAEGSEEKQA